MQRALARHTETQQGLLAMLLQTMLANHNSTTHVYTLANGQAQLNMRSPTTLDSLPPTPRLSWHICILDFSVHVPTDKFPCGDAELLLSIESQGCHYIGGRYLQAVILIVPSWQARLSHGQAKQGSYISRPMIHHSSMAFCKHISFNRYTHVIV